MKGIGYDSMGAMVEYDLTPKNEYLVIFDRSGDVIVRRMILSHSEAHAISSRVDIYSVILVNTLTNLPLISVEDLGEEEYD
jgi:hypothetical protein